MHNRFGQILSAHSSRINSIHPANQSLRIMTALELGRITNKNSKVLDLGCGDGESTCPLLLFTDCQIDAVDVSKTMLKRCQQNLKKFKNRVFFIQQDALAYLKKSPAYDVITSSWTIHNFSWSEKKKLFQQIYAKLNPGGTLLLMDKIYPDKNRRSLFDLQMKRNKRYLPITVSKALIRHEEQDYSEKYRMDEVPLKKMLEKIGFKKIQILARVEREALLIAKKQKK